MRTCSIEHITAQHGAPAPKQLVGPLGFSSVINNLCRLITWPCVCSIQFKEYALFQYTNNPLGKRMDTVKSDLGQNSWEKARLQKKLNLTSDHWESCHRKTRTPLEPPAEITVKREVNQGCRRAWGTLWSLLPGTSDPPQPEVPRHHWTPARVAGSEERQKTFLEVPQDPALLHGSSTQKILVPVFDDDPCGHSITPALRCPAARPWSRAAPWADFQL